MENNENNGNNEIIPRWERVKQIMGMIFRDEPVKPSVLSKVYGVCKSTAKGYIKDAKTLMYEMHEDKEEVYVPLIRRDTASLTGVGGTRIETRSRDERRYEPMIRCNVSNLTGVGKSRRFK